MKIIRNKGEKYQDELPLAKAPDEVLHRVYDHLSDFGLFHSIGLLSQRFRLSAKRYLQTSSKIRWKGVSVQADGVRKGLREAMGHEMSLMVNVCIALSAFEMVEDGGRQSVWEALAGNEHLRALRLLFVSGDEVTWIAHNLVQKLEVLELWYGTLGESGARALASQPSGRLQELVLGSCDVEGPVADVLFASSQGIEDDKQNRNLRLVEGLDALTLSLCPLRDDGMLALSTLRLPRLRKLVLERCEFGDQGLSELRVDHLPNLAELALIKNRISTRSATVLSEFCSMAHRLRTLQLSWNRLGDDGVSFLPSSKLVSLDLRHCSITEKGCRVLAESKTLECINLCGNRMVEGYSLASGEGLRSLTELRLDNCKVADKGAFAIANGQLSRLRYLSLRGSLISETGVSALAQGNLPSLRTIVLQGNLNTVNAECTLKDNLRSLKRVIVSSTR